MTVLTSPTRTHTSAKANAPPSAEDAVHLATACDCRESRLRRPAPVSNSHTRPGRRGGLCERARTYVCWSQTFPNFRTLRAFCVETVAVDISTLDRTARGRDRRHRPVEATSAQLRPGTPTGGSVNHSALHAPRPVGREIGLESVDVV